MAFRYVQRRPWSEEDIAARLLLRAVVVVVVGEREAGEELRMDWER